MERKTKQPAKAIIAIALNLCLVLGFGVVLYSTYGTLIA
jgi:hypothetical protein